MKLSEGGFVYSGGVAFVDTCHRLTPSEAERLCGLFGVDDLDELRTKTIVIDINTLDYREWLPNLSEARRTFIRMR